MGLLDKILGINGIKETEFIKAFDTNNNENLNQLNLLLAQVSDESQEKIKQEIICIKSGLAGEQNVYYELKNSRLPLLCLHDIRLEYKNYEAQFDFIVIASNFILVIETKRIYGNITVDSEGNFTKEYYVNNRLHKEGMYSPITQNERHISLLTEFLKDYKLIHNCPIYSLIVIANDKTIIDKKYAKAEVKNIIIKYDQLIDRLRQLINTNTQVKMPSKTMHSIADLIGGANKPITIDYVKKLSLVFLPKKEEVKDNSIEETNESVNHEENKTKLYQELKDYRYHKSKELNIKPYFIYNNNELDLLVSTKPQTKEAFIDLPGFAEKKYEAYGEDIIKIIKNRLEDIQNTLIKYRLDKSKTLGLKAYEIFNNQQLSEIMKILPNAKEQLEGITYYKKQQVDAFGLDIIDIINKLI